MEFREISLDKAGNTILAHSLNLDSGRLRKGSLLGSAEIEALARNGYRNVMVAILDEDDVTEDLAAETLARAVAGENVRADKPATGRCNLRAAADGLLVVNGELLDRINMMHESCTLAVLQPFVQVRKSQLVATIKIIPYAAPRPALDACLDIAGSDGDIIRVAEYAAHSIGLVQTRVSGLRDEVLDKTAKVLSYRLDVMNSRIHRETRCQHEAADVRLALGDMLVDDIDMIIVTGASAVADRRDTIPAAIVECGGEILHFGMPVEPGNQLLLARIADKHVIVMPGCARSPKANGFDLVLNRLLARIPVTSSDIMRMGVGGLLKEVRESARPRQLRSGKSGNRATHVTAVVLAAGQSSRMGATNKLLVDLGGRPMIQYIVDSLLESEVREIIVVTGFEENRIRSALKDRDIRFVSNPDYDQGMSTSLAAGLLAASGETDAVMICLADMPLVTRRGINLLIANHDPVACHEICLPTYQGKRGHPVLWSRRFIREMLQIEGDIGARQLLTRHEEVVHEVPMEDPGVVYDVDTPEAIEALQNRFE